MRVFNLTDYPTAAAKARGLANVKLRVGGIDIAPGGHADVAYLGSMEQLFVRCGALAVDAPPAWYRAKKAAHRARMPVKKISSASRAEKVESPTAAFALMPIKPKKEK
jgi:hypothetical protein